MLLIASAAGKHGRPGAAAATVMKVNATDAEPESTEFTARTRTV